MDQPPSFLQAEDGARLAYRHTPGDDPGILFCPGFHSDMQGDKALALEAWCREGGRQFTRFDYFGHGESDGAAEKGRIGRWAADTVHVLDEVTRGKQVIVGSSMGGWLMLLATLARPERVCGLVGIASAPDFSRSMTAMLRQAGHWEALQRQGYCDMPSHYPGESTYRIESAFLEEAGQHCLLDGPVPIDIPVRLLHGQADSDVPWQRSIELAEQLVSDDVEVLLVKDGDHRLSRPDDLCRLLRTVDKLLADIDGQESLLVPPGD
ncbi:MAG: alpha/beta hydrolase [Halieaceae bacterium]|nr:alpha/beta hydrolase [Halieaceae bacterium]